MRKIQITLTIFLITFVGLLAQSNQTIKGTIIDNNPTD